VRDARERTLDGVSVQDDSGFRHGNENIQHPKKQPTPNTHPRDAIWF
jgi:hypothetical protein